MSLFCCLDEDTGIWSLEQRSRPRHNHEASESTSSHINHRVITPEIQAMIELDASINCQPRTILTRIQKKHPNLTESLVLQDIRNAVKRYRIGRSSEHPSIAAALLEKLQERSYYYRYSVDDEDHIDCLFFCHPRSVEIYQRHHDLLFLDATYKTNEYSLPLLNIVAVTGENTSIQLGVCFLRGETEEHYLWALRQIKDLQTDNKIPAPTAFFHDQDVALVNALETVFPGIPTLLCSWHVRKNVGKNAKTIGGSRMADIETWETVGENRRKRLKKTNEAPAFLEFMQAFEACIATPTQELYEERHQRLRTLNPLVADYVDNQYFDLWKHKLVACYIDQITYFGTTTTSRVESAHYTMKSWLKTSKMNILELWGVLELLWESQHKEYERKMSDALIKVPSVFHTSEVRSFWARVVKQIFLWPLFETRKQWEVRNEGSSSCSGVFSRVNGRPCRHKIKELFDRGRGLRPEDFHPHYWIHRNLAPEMRPLIVLDPRSIRSLRELRREQHAIEASRSHQRGDGASG